MRRIPSWPPHPTIFTRTDTRVHTARIDILIRRRDDAAQVEGPVVQPARHDNHAAVVVHSRAGPWSEGHSACCPTPNSTFPIFAPLQMRWRTAAFSHGQYMQRYNPSHAICEPFTPRAPILEVSCTRVNKAPGWGRVGSHDAVLLIPRRPASPATPPPVKAQSRGFTPMQYRARLHVAAAVADTNSPFGDVLASGCILVFCHVIRRRGEVDPIRGRRYDSNKHASPLEEIGPPTPPLNLFL